MELLIKASGAALIGCVCMVLVKRHAPEHSLLLGICSAIVILAAAMPAVESVMELWSGLHAAASLSGAVVAPVAKCVGLGIVTRLSADLCRDSGSAAIATAVETVGCICALLAAGPLMKMLLDTVGG